MEPAVPEPAEHQLSAGQGGQRAGLPGHESDGQKPCQHARPQVITPRQGSQRCELITCVASRHAFWDDGRCYATQCWRHMLREWGGREAFNCSVMSERLLAIGLRTLARTRAVSLGRCCRGTQGRPIPVAGSVPRGGESNLGLSAATPATML